GEATGLGAGTARSPPPPQKCSGSPSCGHRCQHDPAHRPYGTSCQGRMMSRAVITVLSPTLAGNALLRTHVLLRLLRNQYDLQVVAFEASDRIFAPLAEDPLLKDPRRYHAGNIAAWTWRVNRLAKTIRGDAIYCVKPMLGSFGAGL